MGETAFTVPQRLAIDCEVFDKIKDQLAADMRCSCPGIVMFSNLTTAPASFSITLPSGQTYNGTCQAQCVVVQPCLREVLNLGGTTTIVTLPVLLDVPIGMFRAGGFMITLPIAAGDECLVIFGDQAMDSWWQSGGVQTPMDLRRHDLSDGYALPVVWSQPRLVSNYSTNSLRIRNEANTNFIDLSATALTLQFGPNVITLDNTAIWINSGNYGTTFIGSGSYDTEIDGRVFLQHAHNRVQGGGGISGGVQ